MNARTIGRISPSILPCTSLAALLSLMMVESPGSALDWPRWRGPAANGISAETGTALEWPKEGPRQVWKANVGVGFSSVSVHKGRVFTLGNQNDQDVVWCLDSATGAPVWKHSYASTLDPKYYEGGTSATPTVDGEHVFTFGRHGDVFCLEAATGKVVWGKNLAKDLGLNVPDWGFAGSPLIDGNLVLLNAGAHGVALDKLSGKVVWSSGTEASGYSTPLVFDMNGTRAVALFTAQTLAAVDVATGRKLWSHPWKTSYDVNAADPILFGDALFISSGYNHGCALVRFKDGAPKLVWENKNLKNQINSSVHLDGFIYGFDGDAGPKSPLRCIDAKTGEVRWTQTGIGAGALCAVENRLLVIGDKGELLLVQAAPDAFKSLARAQVTGGKCWTTPVISNGRIYVRNASGSLLCLDATAKTL